VDESLIATTLNRDLLAQGVGGQLAVQHWEQLTQYLRRALSPRHAALFAEPRPAPVPPCRCRSSTPQRPRRRARC
jgi:hypothetical protein